MPRGLPRGIVLFLPRLHSGRRICAPPGLPTLPQARAMDHRVVPRLRAAASLRLTSNPMPGTCIDPGEAWLQLMRSGRLAEAWSVSDAVLARRRDQACFQLPRHRQWIWRGESFEGRSVLVRCYHGLGDTVQMLRYLPLLETRAREVVLWVQPCLRELAATVPGTRRIEALHDGAPDFACESEVEIMELPHAFRTTLATIPGPCPYVSAAREELAPTSGLRVGLAWEAGSWDPRRSVPVEALAPLRGVAGIEWHLLQQGEAARLPPPGFGPPPPPRPVMQTAALMRALDLVITVDSFPAHLAGALAVPVWTLLHAAPDWRWMVDRDDCPWYPTMRLFRQTHPGAWKELIERVARELPLARRARSPTPGGGPGG